MTDLRHKHVERERTAPPTAREELAANLRRAFPLGDTGSFVGLLRAIDERAG